MQTVRPTMSLLSDAQVERIVNEAMAILGKVGIYVENKEARELIASNGGRIADNGRAIIPEGLARKALGTAPESVTLYGRNGKPVTVGGLNVNFDPGSAAIFILDSDTKQIRQPVTRDVVRFARLTDSLKNIDCQSTGVVPSDVPLEMADRYRMYIGLMNCAKPMVTGTFAVDGFGPMSRMLETVVGGSDKLRQRPMAIFDACPSPPLKWSNLTTQSLIDCSRAGIPSELISMPLTGATSPAAIAGALVQHAAESIAGVVIHQLACPSSPVIYGGSPAAFDMRASTTPMGAIETMMIDSAYSQIGHSLGLPTHAYMALSDSKALDAQAGLETGIGAALAALAGVNMVSGPGMLAFENCQSLEKLVVDDDICGMIKRLVRGIDVEEPLATELYGDLEAGDLFLTSDETLRRLRTEFFYPSATIDRLEPDMWRNAGSKTAFEHAKEIVDTTLATHEPEPMPEGMAAELTSIMLAEARKFGVDKLPSA